MELLIYPSKKKKEIKDRINKFSFNDIYCFLFRSGLSGSAICIYKVDELERVFTSPYLTQKSNESYWLPSTLKQESEKVISLILSQKS